MSHNYFTSLSISPNRNWLIISILILILYEHLISFTQSLRFLCINASLRNAELVVNETTMCDTFSASDVKSHLVLSNWDIPGVSAEWQMMVLFSPSDKMTRDVR